MNLFFRCALPPLLFFFCGVLSAKSREEDPRFAEHYIRVYVYEMGSHTTRRYSEKIIRDESSVKVDIFGKNAVKSFDDIINYSSIIKTDGEYNDIHDVWPNIVIDYFDNNGNVLHTFFSDGCGIYSRKGMKVGKGDERLLRWIQSLTMTKPLGCVDAVD